MMVCAPVETTSLYDIHLVLPAMHFLWNVTGKIRSKEVNVNCSAFKKSRVVVVTVALCLFDHHKTSWSPNPTCNAVSGLSVISPDVSTEMFPTQSLIFTLALCFILYIRRKKNLHLMWIILFQGAQIWVTYCFEDVNLHIQFAICNISNGIFGAIWPNASNLLFQRSYMRCKQLFYVYLQKSDGSRVSIGQRR